MAVVPGAVMADPPAVAAASVSPTLSADEIINKFKDSSAPNCDADGNCTRPSQEDRRGFSLFAPTPGAHPAPHAARRRHAPRPVATVSAPAAAHEDLLITFELDSARLSEEGKANARVFAEAMMRPELADMKFEIQGHADATGSASANLLLSQARADAVMNFMIGAGADASRMTAKGYGSTRPIDRADPAAAVNRRVEAVRIQ